MPETGQPPYDWKRAAELMAASGQREPRPKSAAELALEKARELQREEERMVAQDRLRDHTTARMVNAVTQKALKLLESLDGLKTKYGTEVQLFFSLADAEKDTLTSTLNVVISPDHSIDFEGWRRLTDRLDQVGLKAHDASELWAMMAPEDVVKFVLPRIARHLLVDQDPPTEEPELNLRPLDL